MVPARCDIGRWWVAVAASGRPGKSPAPDGGGRMPRAQSPTGRRARPDAGPSGALGTVLRDGRGAPSSGTRGGRAGRRPCARANRTWARRVVGPMFAE